MIKMGFHTNCVALMMRCVSSIKYSVKINGQPCGNIAPTRGLRQGNPLSPLLFLICAEGLSALLKKVGEQGTLRGVVACTRVPKISHLFFADDSLVFFLSIHKGGMFYVNDNLGKI